MYVVGSIRHLTIVLEKHEVQESVKDLFGLLSKSSLSPSFHLLGPIHPQNQKTASDKLTIPTNQNSETKVDSSLQQSIMR